MRFYYQEVGQKVVTKCIRVSSAACTRDVIDALVEKLHPDLKMLTNSDFSIWEVYGNGDEHVLGLDDRPLLAQLRWHEDNRDGRFQLRSNDRPQYLPLSVSGFCGDFFCF